MTQPNVLGEDGAAPGPGRDRRLSWFASGGRYDRAAPDAGMTWALESVTDDSGRPPADADDDEVVGMLGRWQTLEAHAHARMLAAVREIIRRRVPYGEATAAYPGDLPRHWDIGVAHEVAAELRISWQAADPLVHLAWDLEARLPGTGRLLDAGVLTALKARIVSDEFAVLDDEHAARAQKLLLEHDLAADAMTPGRLRKLCQKIADTVDPEGARARREDAARDRARVSFFRAHGGDTALFAEGLPPDDALLCQASIQARAQDYKKTMVYPEAGMDLLRVLAMVDLINGASLDDRIARYHAEHAAAENARNAEQRARDQETAESLARHHRPAPQPAPATGTGTSTSTGQDDSTSTGSGGAGHRENQGSADAGTSGRDHEWPSDHDAGDPATWRYDDDPDKPQPPVPDTQPEDLDADCQFWPGHSPVGGYPEPGSPRPVGLGGPDKGGAPGGTRGPGLPALTHLILPLATLLHLGDKPGEAPGYGSIDPGLARDLARAAARSTRTRFCLTITDEHGHATAHACARLIPETAQPARATGPPGGWDLTPDDTRTGPDGGYGSWILTVPGNPNGSKSGNPRGSEHGTTSGVTSGNRRYRLDLYPVPTHDCDHRFATDAYRPGAKLRHLVEIRDGECTFTGCSHPASRCDFDHAVPYDKGGPTDACNGGVRSRRCHRVKQSPGWSVTQPEPGRHQWTTPSGRTYTKEPREYPD